MKPTPISSSTTEIQSEKSILQTTPQTYRVSFQVASSERKRKRDLQIVARKRLVQFGDKCRYVHAIGTAAPVAAADAQRGRKTIEES